MSPDTIEINTSDGKRYINPENISFIRSSVADNGTLLYVLSSIPALLLISLAVFSDSGLEFYFVLIGLVGSGYLLYILLDFPVSTISTINNEIKLKDRSKLSDKLSDEPMNTITISGKQRTLLKTYYYDHTFVVDNIVSIEEKESSLTGSEALILILLIISSLLVTPLEGTIISVIGVLLFLSALAFAYILLQKPNITVVELQGGQKKEFVMTREDSGNFVTEFQQKT